MQIENSVLKVQVKPEGGELVSIQDKETGLEYLWQADPSHWGRHAPVLFPIVGSLKNGKTQIGRQEYAMGQHGFARDMVFEKTDWSEKHVVYTLEANEKSMAMYPFRFLLQIRYELSENYLYSFYTVINQDNSPMPFTIGLHPAFRCPLLEGEEFEDYYLEFELAETLSRTLLSEGLLLNTGRPLLDQEKRIPLSYDLFNEDAIILENFQSRFITLKNKNNAHAVTVGIESWPFLGIWSKKGGAPFVCIEPWMGTADLQDGDGIFENKKGVITLQPQEKFKCATYFAFS